MSDTIDINLISDRDWESLLGPDTMNMSEYKGTRSFRRFDNPLSKLVCEECLTGKSYPFVQNIGPVRVIADVGANIGASVVYFATVYPVATIHAYEPSPTALPLLEHNTTKNFVIIHPFALGGENGTRTLYHDFQDCVKDSFHRPELFTLGDSLAFVRSAREALAGIGHIDILKIDTEGCEVEILENLAEAIIPIKVIYVEYHSWADRIRIDQMLAPTHLLMHVNSYWNHPLGELTYLNKTIVEQWDKELNK
jgi:FkbM family methyltransferase